MDTFDISRSLAIEGWMSEEELLWLAQQASTCRRIIEVGCFLGRSTVTLAQYVQGQVYAVDPWEPAWEKEIQGSHAQPHVLIQRHPDRYHEFLANTDEFWKAKKLSVFRGVLRDLLVEGVDMVFIDGSHREEAVREDIRNGFLRLRFGGLLCGHDYGYAAWPDVKKVVDGLFPKFIDGINPVGSIWAVRV